MSEEATTAELIYKAALYGAIREAVDSDLATSPAIEAVRVAGATIRETIGQVLAQPAYDRDQILRHLLDLCPPSPWGERPVDK